MDGMVDLRPGRKFQESNSQDIGPEHIIDTLDVYKKQVCIYIYRNKYVYIIYIYHVCIQRIYVYMHEMVDEIYIILHIIKVNMLKGNILRSLSKKGTLSMEEFTV